jgi:hypothetical protein
MLFQGIVLQLLLLAAAVCALPLPVTSGHPVLVDFKPVNTNVAAGREILADVTVHVSQSANLTAWIAVQSNSSGALVTSKTSLSLCDFTGACPLPVGAHTIRIPALLPRASAPGSYSIGISLQDNAVSSRHSSLAFIAKIHETLRVEGCPPCGSVLAYTRNGTPGQAPPCEPSRRLLQSHRAATVFSNGEDQGTGNR